MSDDDVCDVLCQLDIVFYVLSLEGDGQYLTGTDCIMFPFMHAYIMTPHYHIM